MSTRYRSFNTKTQVPIWTDQTCLNCTYRAARRVNDGFGAWVGRAGSMSDVVTHGFDRLSGEGKVIISPMTRYTEEHMASGDFTIQNYYSVFACNTVPKCYRIDDDRGPWAHYLLTGSPSGGSVPVAQSCLAPADIADALSAAATSAWKDVASHSADILQDIAEMRQTLNMLRDPLQRGHTFMDRIMSKTGFAKSRKGRTAIEAYNYASSMWLQYRYGIRPLVRTIDAIIKELQISERPRRYTSRGQFDLFASNAVTGTRVGVATTFDYVYNYGDSYDIRCGIIADDVVTLAKALGCDASGMLALPWELVPYSFVADWFVNVGTFLNAVIPYLSTRPLGSWTTTRRTQTVTFQVIASRATTPSTIRIDRSSSEVRSSTYITTTRTPGITGPSIVLKPQSMSGVLTDLRLIDAITLFTQKMDRVFKG